MGQEELKDTDFLKIGIHAGKRLKDVPDTWFKWAYKYMAKQVKLNSYQQSLWNYINQNNLQ